jgi:hypothetical protein
MNFFNSKKKRIEDLEKIINQEREQYHILKSKHNQLIKQYEDLIKKQNFARLEFCKKYLKLSLSDMGDGNVIDIEKNKSLEELTINRIKVLIAVEEIIQKGYELLSDSLLGKMFQDYINVTPAWERSYVHIIAYMNNHPLNKEQNNYRLEANDSLVSIQYDTIHLINEEYASKIEEINSFTEEFIQIDDSYQL